MKRKSERKKTHNQIDDGRRGDTGDGPTARENQTTLGKPPTPPSDLLSHINVSDLYIARIGKIGLDHFCPKVLSLSAQALRQPEVFETPDGEDSGPIVVVVEVPSPSHPPTNTPEPLLHLGGLSHDPRP